MKYDIKNLTLEEKINYLTGKDTWRTENCNGKVKEVFVADGPSGLRKVSDNHGGTVKATAMPTLSVVSNTWNRELAKLDGSTIADDCIDNDVDVLLAPGVNIKRTPLNGRNFEYFSEDPYLCGELSREFINGVQEKGIGTSLKHYALNNSEWDRQNQSSEADERTIREIYLAPFEEALKAKPWTVMCSYNPVNGIYASENKWLLDGLLRKTLGFDGVIVSDWVAVHSPYRSHKASLDLEMPHKNHSYDNIKNAYDKGLITIEEIDACVIRLLQLAEKTENNNKKTTFTKEQRHANAVKIAEEGMVLLKNDGALPIKSGKTVVCHSDLYIGGEGSSAVETEYVQTDLIQALNENTDKSATFIKSNAYLGVKYFGKVKALFEEAYESDNVIISVHDEIDGEGRDRTHLRLPQFIEDAIIQTTKINKNVIVVLYGGSAIDMSAWIDGVNAVLYCGYAGEGTTEALVNIINGKISPSGKLSETFPLCQEDTFCGYAYGNGHVDWYSDGIFVGYRYYDKNQLPVLFPFGHGLSYANFTYSNLNIKKITETDYEVSYDITNDSDFDAKEVSEIYVKDVFSMVIRPEKELKGFSKDLIKAHTTKTVKIQLNKRAFAYYSIPLKDWYVENGDFEIYVGSSSQDIRLKGKIKIQLPEETQFSTHC